MPHELHRPCLSCLLRDLLSACSHQFNYTTLDIINHVASVLAELSVVNAKEGQEQQATETLIDLVREYIKDETAEAAQRKAAMANVVKFDEHAAKHKQHKDRPL